MNCQCGSPLPDGFVLCAACGDLLAVALGEVAGVVEVLDAGLSRASLTARYGERVSSSGSLHAPLPINETLHDAKHGLHKALMKAALGVAEIAGPLTNRAPAGLAQYLVTHLEVVRRQHWAPGLEAELRKHLKHGHERNHKQDDRVFAGTCPDCQTDLYAARGDTHTNCAGCGTQYDVLRWRTHAETAQRYYIGTPADLSRKLSSARYNHTVTADQIRKWANRGKLDRANPELSEAGEQIPPHYRLGDVLKLVNQRLTKHPINGAA